MKAAVCGLLLCVMFGVVLSPSQGSTVDSDFACPTGAVVVSPGESIQGAIDGKGKETTFCIRRGLYRLKQAIVPKYGTVLIFEEGAVLDGSRIISNWSKSGEYWVAGGQTQSFADPRPVATPCVLNPPACEFEDVFRDGRPLLRVLSKEKLVSGTFYFDESADKIFVVDDPSGHRLEATIAATAIDSAGVTNVKVKGATIQKLAHYGISSGKNWSITDNEIRYVHSTGIRMTGKTQIYRNFVHHAGTLGMSSRGDDIIFVANELAFNNYLKFGTTNGPWSAGAIKITHSKGAIVRDNHSHDNVGNGWWFDTDNINYLVEGNTFEANTRYGLSYEESFGGVVRNNIFRNNGGSAEWSNWFGLWINTSKNIEAYGNLFEGSVGSAIGLTWTDRGSSPTLGEYRTENLDIHDNIVKIRNSTRAVEVPFGKTTIYSANNRFRGNDYYVPNLAGRWWRWNGDRTWAEWRALGQNGTGTISIN
jgi:uncharacterized protein YoaH (UPF0181 family)